MRRGEGKGRERVEGGRGRYFTTNKTNFVQT